MLYASDAGSMGFKSRAYQISRTLPTTLALAATLKRALAQSCGDGHRSLVIPERVLSECKKAFIFLFYKPSGGDGVARLLPRDGGISQRPNSRATLQSLDQRSKMECQRWRAGEAHLRGNHEGYCPNVSPPHRGGAVPAPLP